MKPKDSASIVSARKILTGNLEISKPHTIKLLANLVEEHDVLVKASISLRDEIEKSLAGEKSFSLNESCISINNLIGDRPRYESPLIWFRHPYEKGPRLTPVSEVVKHSISEAIKFGTVGVSVKINDDGNLVSTVLDHNNFFKKPVGHYASGVSEPAA